MRRQNSSSANKKYQLCLELNWPKQKLTWMGGNVHTDDGAVKSVAEV